MWKRALALLMIQGLVGPASFAQTPAQTQEQPTPTIRMTTREVILDVIVRDKHHHAIADLRPDEIEVFEDGVKQKISAFRNVQGAEQLQTEQGLAKSASSTPPTASAEKSPTALREINFVSVVLAQIAPLNLEFAREAVREFLKSDTLPNTYVTIYRLDRALQLVQPYTADKTSLMKAIDVAAKGVNTASEVGINPNVASGINAQVQATAANIVASPLTSPATAQAVQNAALNPIPQIVTDPLWARNAASQDASIALGNALLAQADIESGLRFAESLSNGMDALDSLRQLVRVQSKLPGRKVVLFLADGLSLPMDRRDVVDSVISYANQMEVAFYAVDTRGLSTDDPLAQSLPNLERVGAESSVNKVSPRMGHMQSDDELLTASADKTLAMQELAESTGGFAVTNTNQIALPMQRVMEDIRTHYEVAYAPSATNYDGHFRKIEVRISRPHISVQTRSGYFALPDVNGEPLQPWEMTSLHAINTRPPQVEFHYQAALLRFRPKPASVDYEMAFDVPVSGLRVVTNAKTGKGQIRVSVMALIHKPDGEVVGKVSRELTREVSQEDMPRLPGDHILYASPIELPGGHYLIDTAVTDELAEKSAVKRMSIFVDTGKDFGVSSLELVRVVQPLPGPPDHQDPFETATWRVVPTLAETVPSGKPIEVYFVVYPGTTSEAAPTITLQLYRDGRKVGLKTLSSPQRQADGSMPVLLRITPDPGQCDMVVTAQQGQLTSEASLSVKITSNGASNPN